ncbi:hypothetical protein HDU93_010010 [Gonapodya sp. JEL0774]|nr:hypothetical protein HDU93_010010 [Gonapodya sp. JEL0774]
MLRWFFRYYDSADAETAYNRIEYLTIADAKLVVQFAPPGKCGTATANLLGATVAIAITTVVTATGTTGTTMTVVVTKTAITVTAIGKEVVIVVGTVTGTTEIEKGTEAEIGIETGAPTGVQQGAGAGTVFETKVLITGAARIGGKTVTAKTGARRIGVLIELRLDPTSHPPPALKIVSPASTSPLLFFDSKPILTMDQRLLHPDPMLVQIPVVFVPVPIATQSVLSHGAFETMDQQYQASRLSATSQNRAPACQQCWCSESAITTHQTRRATRGTEYKSHNESLAAPRQSSWLGGHEVTSNHATDGSMSGSGISVAKPRKESLDHSVPFETVPRGGSGRDRHPLDQRYGSSDDTLQATLARVKKAAEVVLRDPESMHTRYNGTVDQMAMLCADIRRICASVDDEAPAKGAALWEASNEAALEEEGAFRGAA